MTDWTDVRFFTMSAVIMLMLFFAVLGFVAGEVGSPDDNEKARITWCLERKGVAKTDRTNRYVGCEFDLAKGI